MSKIQTQLPDTFFPAVRHQEFPVVAEWCPKHALSAFVLAQVSQSQREKWCKWFPAVYTREFQPEQSVVKLW
jgi:hypothetical protein